MTSLTQIAITARKSIRYGIYGIIFLMVGKVFLDMAISVYLKIFPPGPPPPTVKFGKVSKIPFPEAALTVRYNYVLETPEGGLPKDISTQAKVYFMPKLNASLLALDSAKQKAKALNYSDEPEQVSDNIYKFRNPTYPTILEMNITTGVFSISYDLNSDRTPITVKPPIAESAIQIYKEALINANVMPEDLTGPTSHSFFKLSEGKLVNALALSEADVIKVNMFRKEYDKFPSLTSNPNQANVWALISGATTKEQQIIAAEYHYFPVDETQFSTYPIITPEEAFSQLTGGNAFVADPGINNKEGATLKIRRVYLAYYDPDVQTDYFQPIYVFEGDNGFTGYVPAVAPDYVSN